MELANKNAVVEMLKRGKENILLFFEEFYAYEYENSFIRMAEVEKEVKDATEKIFTTEVSQTDN